ncbi:hypothetical protein [Acinetobacter sp. Ac_5812]|uniref:hypothetical protein n=1 Tax=Acinetobacter sp. Ac_5812 TaxID=1848937 RepID=UPI0014903EA5|nr:hypothetical protein [Acinetobacter sp. Ac_5812]
MNKNSIVYIRYLPVIFFMIFSACSYGNKDRLGGENCVLDGKVCLIAKDGDKFLIVGNKEYPSVFYYDEVEIRRLNNKFISKYGEYN